MPFLNKGVTTAYLKRCGKIPKDMDLLHVWVKGELTKEELTFINLVDLPSYPEEFLGLRDFMFSFSLVDLDFRLIFGNEVWKDCIQ